MHTKKGKCEICKQKFAYQSLYPMEMVRNSVMQLITQDFPKVNSSGSICLNDLHSYHLKRNRKLIEEDIGQLSDLEEEVVSSLHSKELLSENINEEFQEHLSFGQKLADAISHFGGSWTFILSFLSFIIIWMLVNSFFLIRHVYDPYPYILLNLVLSCLAALQAPIIMMSQNRRAIKERLEAENDYKVNLKAELQIRHLDSKVDQHAKLHIEHLIELENTQIAIMQLLAKIKTQVTAKNAKPPS